jgi:hypothetical protein
VKKRPHHKHVLQVLRRRGDWFGVRVSPLAFFRGSTNKTTPWHGPLASEKASGKAERNKRSALRTLVWSQIATALVGKQRFEIDMMARPPGFSTRQTSSITARGLVM